MVPFDRLMNWVLTEHKETGKIFGVGKFPKAAAGKTLPIFGEKMEVPLGPAAGPHTQLSQNIIASYVAGGRFFELKTVQALDGHDLHVSKPCILADDEGYNVEWSTELYVPQAMDEYVKAWFALKLLSVELGLGDPDGFVFNMSVGYNLEGIKTEKIDRFIEGLKDAGNTPVWAECRKWALANLSSFKKIDAAYVEAITPKVCRSITLSTMHGCQPDEIERIASYLITEKKLNTYIKCNPTLLGYEYARKTLDDLGFDYLVFDRKHFDADLQYADAIPMIEKLADLAKSRSLAFGLKLTNTFPVGIARSELPGEEMYLSGRALFSLSIAVAKLLSEGLGGKVPIAYSGGAEARNVAEIFEAGIWPITVCTTLLKPGGYERLGQMAEILSKTAYRPFAGIDVPKLKVLVDDATSSRLYQKDNTIKDPYYEKLGRAKPHHKIDAKLPLTDCYISPCIPGCPIEQDIPAYLRLADEGRYLEAMEVIADRNPLPFITGSICFQQCGHKCTRDFYEETVHIRGVKLEVAEHAYEEFMAGLKPTKKSGGKIAVIGGGPAGLSAAYFLSRAGRPVTIFEKKDILGGFPRTAIPEFRADPAPVDKDVALSLAFGVEVRLKTEVKSLTELADFETVIVATGVHKSCPAELKDGSGKGGIDSGLPGVFVIGDLTQGPTTVVESIKDGLDAAERILGSAIPRPYAWLNSEAKTSTITERKGALTLDEKDLPLASRCLECESICENCVEVCPNRANLVIEVDGTRQVVHMDAFCNECGNCESFCPYAKAAPHRDKLNLFSTEEDFLDSRNDGILPLGDGKVRVRTDGKVEDRKVEDTGRLIQALLSYERFRI